MAQLILPPLCRACIRNWITAERVRILDKRSKAKKPLKLGERGVRAGSAPFSFSKLFLQKSELCLHQGDVILFNLFFCFIIIVIDALLFYFRICLLFFYLHFIMYFFIICLW